MCLDFIEDVEQYLQSLKYVVFQRRCFELDVSLRLSLARFALTINVYEQIRSMNTRNLRENTTDQHWCDLFQSHSRGSGKWFPHGQLCGGHLDVALRVQPACTIDGVLPLLH